MHAASSRMVMLRRLSAAVCRSRPEQQRTCFQLEQQQRTAPSSVRLLLQPAPRFLSTAAAASEQSQQQANIIISQQQQQSEPDWVRAAIQKMILEQQQSANHGSGASGERETPSTRDLDKSLQFLQVQ